MLLHVLFVVFSAVSCNASESPKFNLKFGCLFTKVESVQIANWPTHHITQYKLNVWCFQIMKVTVGNFEQCQTPLACLVGGVTIAVTRPEQGQGDNGMGTVMIITSVDTRNMMTGSHQSSATIQEHSRHRRHPHHILWLEPDYLQLTSKYKLKCSNCTSKLLVPAEDTYLVVMFLATHCLINSLSRYLGFMLDCCILCRHSLILGGLLLLLVLVSGYCWFRPTLHSDTE